MAEWVAADRGRSESRPYKKFTAWSAMWFVEVPQKADSSRKKMRDGAEYLASLGMTVILVRVMSGGTCSVVDVGGNGMQVGTSK